MITNESMHPFSSDRPIESKREDILGRIAFADRIADSIRNWKHKDSLVIGLSGPWGSGKTSIKNLILEDLRQHSAASPQICEFNPWQWASQGQIMDAFFKELAIALGKTDKGAYNRKLIATLKKYAGILDLSREMFH